LPGGSESVARRIEFPGETLRPPRAKAPKNLTGFMKGDRLARVLAR